MKMRHRSRIIQLFISVSVFLPVVTTRAFILSKGIATSRRTTQRDASTSASTTSFSSPLLDEGFAPTVLEHNAGTLSNKPLLVYLPGFDGTLVAPFLQFPELGTEFEVWGMSVSMEDRSSVETLCDDVMTFITTKLKREDRKRPLYIMGESFGGILALEVALAIDNYNNKNDNNEKEISSTTATATATATATDEIINLSGIVLINPATCYNQSRLAKDGPPIANGSPILYPFSLMTMVPLFTDDYALPQLIKILQSEGLPSVIDNAEREAYMGRMAFSLPSKLKYMPQGTLKWRLEEWLTKGCTAIESKEEMVKEIIGQLPVLIVAGEKDNTLPSINESQRLQKLLRNAEVHVVNGAGHACTSGSRVDLTALMRKHFFTSSLGRKEMKDQAALSGNDDYFGLEPRYDGASIGLSPLAYWSEAYFQRLE